MMARVTDAFLTVLLAWITIVALAAVTAGARESLARRIARHRRRKFLAGAVARAGRHCQGCQYCAPQPPVGCLVVHPALTEYLAWRDGLPVTEAIITQPPTLIIEGDPDPALSCLWCKPDDPRAANYGTAQPWWDKPCTCGGNCGHPYCLAATWAHPW